MSMGTRGKPLHHNGTATATAVKFEVSALAAAQNLKHSLAWSMRLRNADAVNTLQVSFNNGTNWFTVAGGATFEMDVKFTQFTLRRGGGADVVFEALMAVG